MPEISRSFRARAAALADASSKPRADLIFVYAQEKKRRQEESAWPFGHLPRRAGQ